MITNPGDHYPHLNQTYVMLKYCLDHTFTLWDCSLLTTPFFLILKGEQQACLEQQVVYKPEPIIYSLLWYVHS